MMRSIFFAALLFASTAFGCGDDDASPDGSTPDASGTDAGAMTDAGSTDSGTADADTEVDAGPQVRVLNDGYVAVYQAPDGTVVAEMPTPSAFPLPPGGTVSLLDGGTPVTFFDVPEGADIRLDFGSPVPMEVRQTLTVDVPAPPMHAPRTSTGCSFAEGTGAQTLGMNTTCLAADGTGEIFVLAFQSGTGTYIHVDDIAVGADSDPPQAVALGAWVDVPATQPTFTLDALAPGAESAQVGLYARRGTANLFNSTGGFLPDGMRFARTFLTVIPTIGEEWTRNVLFFRSAAPEARAGAYESVGHPLPLSADLQAGDYLPLIAAIDYAAGTRTVTWSYEGSATVDTDVDRVLVRVSDGSRVWDLWLPPSATEVVLPDLPASYDMELPTTPSTIDVHAQDRFDIDGWESVLTQWGPEVNYLTSPHTWPTHAYTIATWTD